MASMRSMFGAVVLSVLLMGEGPCDPVPPDECELTLAVAPGSSVLLTDCDLGTVPASLWRVAPLDGALLEEGLVPEVGDDGLWYLAANPATIPGVYHLGLDIVAVGDGPLTARLDVTVVVGVEHDTDLTLRAGVGRTVRPYDPVSGGEFVVPALTTFALRGEVRTLSNVDIVTWTLSPLSDPLDLRPEDGVDLTHAFTLDAGGWDLQVVVRDDARNMVELHARIYAVPVADGVLESLSQVATCESAVAALGPCDAGQSPACLRAELVELDPSDGVAVLDGRRLTAEAREVATGVTSARPVAAGSALEAELFAVCVGEPALEDVWVSDSATVHPGGGGVAFGLSASRHVVP